LTSEEPTNFTKPTSVFSRFSFVLASFRLFLSDVGSKALKKTFYKKVVSKIIYKKKRPKKPKLMGVSRFSVIGVRGVQKHDKKISGLGRLGGNLTSPGFFLASEEPTNHAKARVQPVTLVGCQLRPQQEPHRQCSK
jgi:hypothetical protein